MAVSKLKKIFPRITTRGFYDLKTGKTIIKSQYRLYPKKKFDELIGSKELTIMIHGLRNNNSGALSKFRIVKKRLKQLGYNHNIVGFSYDSNTVGAQYTSQEIHALNVGIIIANKNGKNLAEFIIDFKNRSPATKIRLIGHSLGSHVILSTIKKLSKKNFSQGIIESVYFFGASISHDSLQLKNFSKSEQKTIKSKIKNYYSQYDEVLRIANDENLIPTPIGYKGIIGKTTSKYSQILVKPKNHRFVSYISVLRSFP